MAKSQKSIDFVMRERLTISTREIKQVAEETTVRVGFGSTLRVREDWLRKAIIIVGGERKINDSRCLTNRLGCFSSGKNATFSAFIHSSTKEETCLTDNCCPSQPISFDIEKCLSEYQAKLVNELRQYIQNDLHESLQERASRIVIIDEPEAHLPHLHKKEKKQDGRVNNSRPKAIEIYDRFKDTDMIQVLKDIYCDTYKKAIEVAKDLKNQLIGYLLAIYEKEGCERDLATHYYEIFKEHFTKDVLSTIKLSLRTLQRSVKKFYDLKCCDVMTALQKKTYNTWKQLKAMYVRGIERLEAENQLPQLALS